MAKIICLNERRALKQAQAALHAVGGKEEPGWELDEDAMAEYFAIITENKEVLDTEGGDD